MGVDAGICHLVTLLSTTTMRTNPSPQDSYPQDLATWLWHKDLNYRQKKNSDAQHEYIEELVALLDGKEYGQLPPEAWSSWQPKEKVMVGSD